MVFATARLAARIERAEAQTALDFAQAAGRRGADVSLVEISGTHAVYGGPNQPFNKLVGLGFGVPLDEAALARAEADHDARGAALRVEYATLADREIAAVFSRRGYELVGFENVLGLDLRSFQAGAAAAGIDVRRIGDAEITAWIDTVTDGFAHPDTFDGPSATESFDRDTLRRVFEDFGAAPASALYLAHIDGRIAGGGASRTFDGIAQLCGAATLPAYRRRGVQSTLLRERLRDAASLACDIAIVTTEPGSKSQENVQRAGFELLYARAILVRPPRDA